MDRPDTGARRVTPERRQFFVSGMTCAAEAIRLELDLVRQNGVISAVVNPVTDRAYIEYDPASVSETDLIAFIESIGFRE